MIDNTSVGNQILLLRKRNGLTQEDLAEKLGISAQAISKWENGHTLPETALLPLLAKLLNSSIDSILMPIVIKAGATIPFGKHRWRVLKTDGNSVLVITEATIGKAPYHDGCIDISWEHCCLRKYLNGAFYDQFAEKEKSRIIKTKLSDRNNPWYGTKCGNATFDHIFLLSYDEIIQYFGDSGDMQNKKGFCWAKDDKLIPCDENSYLQFGDCIYDKYNDARKAQNAKGADDWWWLRSPGGQGMHTAGSIGYFGEIFMCGDDVYRVDGGVRPALWLSL